MYVCVCHGIRCRDVRAVAETGKCRAADVFRAFEARPQCGKCLATMTALLAPPAELSRPDSDRAA